jgi:hypothetical protein
LKGKIMNQSNGAELVNIEGNLMAKILKRSRMLQNLGTVKPNSWRKY